MYPEPRKLTNPLIVNDEGVCYTEWPKMMHKILVDLVSKMVNIGGKEKEQEQEQKQKSPPAASDVCHKVLNNDVYRRQTEESGD